VANALTFAFEAVHQAAGPDKFGGEQAQAENDDNKSGAGSDQHDETSQEQCKSSNDEKNAADLLNRSKDHARALEIA